MHPTPRGRVLSQYHKEETIPNWVLALLSLICNGLHGLACRTSRKTRSPPFGSSCLMCYTAVALQKNGNDPSVVFSEMAQTVSFLICSSAEQ